MILQAANQDKIAKILNKLGTIFGGYGEWGQPIHEVGNDVEVLGLSEPRPDSRNAFRMLCRHNRYVQNFGQIKDPDEMSRRERTWMQFIRALEQKTSKEAGAMPPAEFQSAVFAELDLAEFKLRGVSAASDAGSQSDSG